jgi:hypothetical protein
MKSSKLFIIFSAALLILPGCGLPSKKNIDVPFTSQAPAGDWSEPWQNACEETSIYMVTSYYKNDPIKRDEAVKKIQEILAVKNQNFKVSHDESLETIAELIKTLGLPIDAQIKTDPTVDDLKAELAKDRPIIVPVYSPSLWSSSYHGGGADYHVLVLTGYDDEQGVFIVNDPGSTNGQGLQFPYDKFMAAIHDLNSKNYKAGTKAVLFTKPIDWKLWLESLTE